jgi:hypothetical protein
MPSEDSTRITAEIAALGSTVRVDANDVPRIDFQHGSFPPIPTGTIPAVGANQKASVDALRAAAFDPDEDTNAVTRVVTDAVVNGTTTVTSATAVFVSADVGARVILQGCGVAGADLSTRITARGSATSVTVADAATASGSGKVLRIKSVPNVSFTPAAGVTTKRLGTAVKLGS